MKYQGKAQVALLGVWMLVGIVLFIQYWDDKLRI